MKDMAIQYPWALTLLLLVPLVLVGRERRQRRTAFAACYRVPGHFRPGFCQRRGADLFLTFFLVAAVLAVANPQYATTWQRTFLESKWILLVQDLSGSMYRPAGQTGMTLSDVALEGARAFVAMREKDDLIGVVAFSSYAKLVSPPTFDREILRRKLALLARQSDSPVFRQLAVGGATNASYAAWIALCVFFMLLPDEDQLSVPEMDDLRLSLLGKTRRRVPVPEKLRQARFGHGMAIVIFTDGRIEANQSDEDVSRGIPNFVNVLELVRALGVRLYLISVSGEVNSEVREALEDQTRDRGVGRIIYMPRRFDEEQMRQVYAGINEMEKNRLLTKVSRRKKDSRGALSWAALASLLCCCLLPLAPRYARI